MHREEHAVSWKTFLLLQEKTQRSSLPMIAGGPSAGMSLTWARGCPGPG